MPEKNTAERNFQKQDVTFDELPIIVKKDPKFLYKYMTTGEMPKVDFIKNVNRNYIKIATEMKNDFKDSYLIWEKYFNFEANEEDYKIKEILDKHFDEFIRLKLISFEELYFEMPYDPEDEPLSFKLIKKIVRYAQGSNKRFLSSGVEYYFINMMWSKVIMGIAENKLKELTE